MNTVYNSFHAYNWLSAIHYRCITYLQTVNRWNIEGSEFIRPAVELGTIEWLQVCPLVDWWPSVINTDLRIPSFFVSWLKVIPEVKTPMCCCWSQITSQEEYLPLIVSQLNVNWKVTGRTIPFSYLLVTMLHLSHIFIDWMANNPPVLRFIEARMFKY